MMNTMKEWSATLTELQIGILKKGREVFLKKLYWSLERLVSVPMYSYLSLAVVNPTGYKKAFFSLRMWGCSCLFLFLEDNCPDFSSVEILTLCFLFFQHVHLSLCSITKLRKLTKIRVQCYLFLLHLDIVSVIAVCWNVYQKVLYNCVNLFQSAASNQLKKRKIQNWPKIK